MSEPLLDPKEYEKDGIEVENRAVKKKPLISFAAKLVVTISALTVLIWYGLYTLLNVPQAEIIGNSPDNVSIGCSVGFSTLSEWSRDEPWLGMASKVIKKGVWPHWSDQNLETFAVDDIHVKLTHAKVRARDCGDKQHLQDALYKVMSTVENFTPDAMCVSGRDLLGNEVAFVWGTDEAVVEAMECLQSDNQGLCEIIKDGEELM